MNTPEKILFSNEFIRKDRKKIPLFKNKTALANAIKLLEENDYDSINSLKSILSQTMLLGNKTGHRSVPDKLKDLIVIASKNLIDESDPAYHSFEVDLEDAFYLLKNTDFQSESISSLDIEKERFENSKKGERHMIFTSRPAELFDNYKAEKLKLELINTIKSKSKKYRFFFPDEDIAKKFWETIESGISLEKEIDLDIINQDYLKVFTIDAFHCIHPLEVIDYHKQGKASAFIMHIHGKRGFSISKLSPFDLESWFRLVYNPIALESNNNFNKKEFTYKNYKNLKEF